MTRSISLLVAVVACSSGESTMTATHTRALRDSVRSMLDDFRRYAANRQWDSLVSLYVSDSTLRWIEDGEVRLRSSAPLSGYYAALSPTTSIEMTYDTMEITAVAPGAASVLTHYHTTLRDSTRGNFTFGGLLTMTVVHQPSGWHIRNGHTSSPRTQSASPR